MRTMARSGARTPPVVVASDDLTWRAQSEGEAARRIRAFLADRVRFVHDPPGVELIRTPDLMLETILARGHAIGDCDDVAVLGAALAMAAGLSCRYVLVALHPSDPFEHVYTEVLTPEGAIELDTTRPAQMPDGVTIHRVGYREA